MSNLSPDHVEWTSAEDEIIRSTYPSGLSACAAALPGRTREAIRMRSRRLGIPSPKSHWTAEDDARLRKLWNGEMDLDDIASRLGRTEFAVFRRATIILGLPSGCPDGWEYILNAATRTGFSTTWQMRQILRAAGATLRLALVDPRIERIGAWRRHIVSKREVDVAVEAWLEREPVATAALRRGVDPTVLSRRLVRAGVERKRFPGRPRSNGKTVWRVSEEEVEKAMEGYVSRAERGAA